MTDIEYMQLAIELARKGTGAVNPNPLVGAVIVKDGDIIGEGWHEYYGGLHAERNAIKNAKEKNYDLTGATIYVTLEPCCHHGKTPPCTEAVIENKLGRVVIGSLDPNPLVAGKGIDILRKAGIKVESGVLEKECDELNQVFFHYIKNKTPYVVMKYAMTLDGKICTVAGNSKWITGEKARENVHKDRSRYMGIMVGVGTVVADDPELTCRADELEGVKRNPIRIICDTSLTTPLNSKLVETAKDTRTIIATACNYEQKQQLYTDRGCELVVVDKKDDHIDLNELMIKLGEMGIDSILLEGGSTLNYSAISSGIVNKVQAYIAPKIWGGNMAKTPVGGMGVIEVADGFEIENMTLTQLGEDFLLSGEVKRKCLQE